MVLYQQCSFLTVISAFRQRVAMDNTPRKYTEASATNNLRRFQQYLPQKRRCTLLVTTFYGISWALFREIWTT